MRKKNLIFLSFIIILLSGCSQKINPVNFNPVNAPKSKFLPSKNEIYSKTQILIVPFKGKNETLNETATATLKTLLENYPPIKILNRPFRSLKQEIKLAELAKTTNSNLNQADYIIEGKIISTSTKSIYHPPQTWKDKKGHYHTIPGYYENRACVNGVINIIKIPENYFLRSKYFSYCTYEDDSYAIYNFIPLLTYATKQAILSLKDYLYKTFAKRGYIFEIRKKGDTEIIHTTLGSNFGAKEGEKVDIYTVKEIKVPFSSQTKKEIIKIGNGVISNVVNPNDSWIIVKNIKEPIKIGDFVKMNYHHSFWDIFK
jgi:hypothetical protein